MTSFSISFRLALLVGALLFVSTANAAPIYGTLTENSQAVAGLEITVRCADGSAFQATTNDSGSYSVRVDTAGYCTFIVTTAREPSLEIYVYDQPSPYNFNLIRIGRDLRADANVIRGRRPKAAGR
jgi:hypothetical protein